MFIRSTATLFILMLSVVASAQSPDTSQQRASEMIAYYHGLVGEHAVIFTGRAYYDYPPLVGHAYVEGPGWYPGSITYDDIEYRNLFLKYDLVKNVVVVQRPDRVTMVSLQNRLLSRFTIGNKNFVQLNAVDERGDSLLHFYEVMARGKITLLGKKQKTIADEVRTMFIEKVVSEKTSFHVYRDGKYYPVHNLASFLEVVPDRRKELQQYLRKEKIVYRRNPAATLLALAAYYNQTNH